MRRFSGRRAVVTGAAQGIGQAIARVLAAEGSDLLLLDVNESLGTRTAHDCTRDGVHAEFRTCDVASDEAVRAAAEWSRVRWGHIDYLVNNAGIFPRATTCSTSEAAWLRVIGTNLGGPFHCVKHFVPLMPEHGGAAIVNVSSSRALVGAANGAAYAASKAGVLGLTKSWAQEFAGRGLRVNALVPGLTDTAQPREVMDEEALRVAGSGIPLGRIGDPMDMARGVAYLLGEDAAYMTGQTLVINGGAIMP